MSWQLQIIELLTASLIRPVALAAAAWLILRLYKVRHPASRHAVWTAVLIGMMALPLVTFIAPQWKLPLLPTKPEAVAQTQIPQSENFTEAESSDVSPNTPVSVPASWPALQTLIVWRYLAGVFAMMIFRLTGWALLWRVMSKSSRLKSRLHESSEVVAPVTIGALRPSVILPTGWRGWNANTKRAVLAHEFAHIRRRDTLTSSLTRFAKCIYWFHPLAWWISRQISELAELSCDAAALEKNGDPGSYSRILLGFAETVNAAGHRATLPGLAIASRSGMGHRIDQVFELASGNLRRLSRPGTVLVFMGLPMMCIAAVVGLTAPASRVLHQAAAAITQSQPVVLAQSQQPAAPPPRQAPASKPKFDVASIKPCARVDDTPGPGRGTPGGGASIGGMEDSPGRLRVNCMTVLSMVENAYSVFSHDPPVNNASILNTPGRTRGGPAWVRSDRYAIEAQTNDPLANGPTMGRTTADFMLMGTMLQTLLEDRFHLKIRPEVESVPMYALTVAKSGLKLTPLEADGCEALPAPGTGMKRLGPDDKPYCNAFGGGTNGPNRTLYGAATLGKLAQTLHLDRLVLDRTAITTLFRIRLEYVADETTPCTDPRCAVDPTSDIPPGPTIFTALERLGLKLEPINGTRGYVVIDSVEHPTAN